MFRCAAVFAVLLTATCSYAQIVGGTISGRVLDSAGAVLPKAQITIRNQETGGERHLVSDAAGAYAAPSIPVGVYTVIVSSEGFAQQTQTGISLTVGQATRVDITLHLGNVAEQVTVQDTPSVVNLSTQQTSGLVDERQVKNLPLNGRSYDQLIMLNPATVNYTAQRSGSIGTSNSSVGNMFAVSGRRPQDNVFLLNGIEYTGASLINVTPGGTSGQLLGIDAVREFNVVSDTYSASYGKRQGAQISIVTASGTNKIHGSGYEFLRNSFFDARNYFDQARIPEFQRNNYGASLGGPIRHNKLFLFGNYESYRQNLGISDVTLVPDNASRAAAVASVKPYLALWPVQNGPELGGGIAEAFSSPTQHIREDFGTARFDANLSARDLLFAVYTADDSTANTPTQNPFSLINESLREQVISVQEQHVFSASLLNTARIGYSRASFFFLGNVPSSIQANVPGFITGKPTGAIVIAGSTASNGSSQLTGAGGNVGSNNATTRNLYTLDDHVFYSKSHHQIEAGVWLQALQSNDNLAQNQDGQASFASLATFLQGTVKTFTIVPNPTPLNWHSFMGAAYIEDIWLPTPRLEVRGGIRFESTNGWNEARGRASQYGFTNGIINTSPTVGSSALSNNRAKFLPEPRVGLAWNVFGNGKTSLHASVGLHHSLLDNLNYRLDQAAPYNTTLTYANVPIATPTIGAPGLISPSNVQTDLATPTVISYNLAIEQQLGSVTSLTVAYVGSHGYHQILSEDQNEPAAVVCSPTTACPTGTATGTVYYPSIIKANPLVANTTSWTSGGSSSYNALEIDLRRSLSRNLQFRANYTYAKNLDDGSAWNTSVSANTPAFVSYPANPSLDYGRAATDIRHLAAINATYKLPVGKGQLLFASAPAQVDRVIGGWSLSTIAALQSGFPFSPQLGYNPTGSGDTRNPVRPNLNPDFKANLYTQGNTATRVAQFFSPAAFTAPAYGTVGNLGRDTLTGPGYTDWDLSLLKSTQLNDRARLEFRAEFFNVLNHTNLQTPNEVVFTSGPTQGNAAAQTAPIVRSPTAGVVTAAATSRQIQLALKLLF
ncbi:carboxypeptidase-like regulatory domain-containing protein [Granulicella arctica]|uniref:carboxypeptidase-like regulatory domain-containing protein n=1 Tax=Granulicella arctica TaxID=940613 RepID=UPI0021DFCB6E|nr:carboxypeptidase-like regulatory domain-containing protein [Granulicella arctica]